MSDHDLGTVPDQVVQRPQQRAPPVADLFRHRDEHHHATAAGGRALLLVQLVRHRQGSRRRGGRAAPRAPQRLPLLALSLHSPPLLLHDQRRKARWRRRELVVPCCSMCMSPWLISERARAQKKERVVAPPGEGSIQSMADNVSWFCCIDPPINNPKSPPRRAQARNSATALAQRASHGASWDVGLLTLG